MNIFKKVCGISLLGMALAMSLPVSAKIAMNELASNKLASNKLAGNRLASNRLASNKLAGNRLASNKLSSNKLAASAGAGAFSDVATVVLSDGTRLTR